jgi:hypothetical protein
MMSVPGTAETHAKSRRLCSSTAFLLCMVHALSVSGIAYYELARGDLNLINKEAIITYGTWASPVFLILIVRQVCLLVFISAVPVVVIFAAQAFHIWGFHALGSLFVAHMGDWGDFAAWLMTLFGALSLAAVAVWSAVWLIVGTCQVLSNFLSTSKGE